MKRRRILQWSPAVIGVAALGFAAWFSFTRPAPWRPSDWERRSVSANGAEATVRVVDEYVPENEFAAPPCLALSPVNAQGIEFGAPSKPRIIATVFEGPPSEFARMRASAPWAGDALADLSAEEFKQFQTATAALSSSCSEFDAGAPSSPEETRPGVPFVHGASEVVDGPAVAWDPVVGTVPSGVRFQVAAKPSGDGWRLQFDWNRLELHPIVESFVRTKILPSGSASTAVVQRPRWIRLDAKGTCVLRPGRVLLIGGDGGIIFRRERPAPESLRAALMRFGAESLLEGPWGRDPRAFAIAIQLTETESTAAN